MESKKLYQKPVLPRWQRRPARLCAVAPSKKNDRYPGGRNPFLDEGVEARFSHLPSSAPLFDSQHTLPGRIQIGRGIARRQDAGTKAARPWPSRNIDLLSRRQVCHADIRNISKDTALKPEDTRAGQTTRASTPSRRAPPPQRSAGIKTILWAEDVLRNDLPNIDKTPGSRRSRPQGSTVLLVKQTRTRRIFF